MSDTYCTKCCFFIKEHDKDIKLCECELNKLSLYGDKGVEIVSINDELVLRNFICPFKRDEYYATTPEIAEERIIEENGFPYSAFIYEDPSIDMMVSVDQILKFDHKPKYLHVTFRYMHQDRDLLDRLSKRIEREGDVRYKLVINLDKELDHFYDSYLAFRLNIQTPFVAVIRGPYISRVDWTTELSYKIQKELLSFPYANSKNNNLLIFPNSILEEYLQYEGEYFIKKILETQCQNYELSR